jgi:hypothetical protein
MKILNRVLKTFRPQASVEPRKKGPTATQTSPTTDRVELSQAPPETKKKSPLKLGALFHGAIGAVVSAIPIIGATAIAGGAAALPWAMDTEKNDSVHSSQKSILAGAAGLAGGALLNVGGLAAAAATGTFLPLLPAAIAGGYLYGKMAQIDSSMGRFDLF